MLLDSPCGWGRLSGHYAPHWPPRLPVAFLGTLSILVTLSMTLPFHLAAAVAHRSRCLVARRCALVGVLLAGVASLAGCRMFSTPPPPTPLDNPMRVYAPSSDALWDHVVDVVDDYFTIEKEDRPRRIGDVLTAGRIDTFPQVGATLLEPWLGDSADSYQRLESTLQTMRRRAVVQVIPADGAYLVEVQVFKELEDLIRPELATNAAGFRVDNSLQRVEHLVVGQPPTVGWIPQGRDCVLEKRMLAQLVNRINCLANKPGGPAH
ncbi:MAG: hypothetical protein JSS27_21450 [Planctomycetes bacterium]|nr:hypothetical protein [Planctomycetota bacterium]